MLKNGKPLVISGKNSKPVKGGFAIWWVTSFSVCLYQVVRHHGEEIAELLRVLARNHPSYGFAKLFHLIENLATDGITNE